MCAIYEKFFGFTYRLLKKSKLILRLMRCTCCLLILALAGNLSLLLAEAEASNPSPLLTTKPIYFEQLENYRLEVELYKKEKERRQRENTLRQAIRQHVVQRGENLSKIAGLYEIDIASLIYWNQLPNPNLIYPGQILDILTVEGTLHHVAKGDTLESIAGRYQVEPEIIASFNLLEDPVQLSSCTKLVIPGGILPASAKRSLQTAKLLASRGEREYERQQSPLFKWPLQGEITSLYGWRNGSFHYGLDIAAPYGAEVRAAAAGIVEYTGIRSGYGLMLIINHGSSWKTLYAHNARLLVGKGQEVAAGQPLALIGATGNATGPHLHLEIIYYDMKLDPLRFLP